MSDATNNDCQWPEPQFLIPTYPPDMDSFWEQEKYATNAEFMRDYLLSRTPGVPWTFWQP